MSNHFLKTTLPNDLRLITVPMEGVQSVTVLIMVGAGSRYETKPINGISHFLEHMAFKGTHKRPSALHISSLIDGIGGEFNAFTSKDHTGYYIKAHIKHTKLIFDVLSDMLLDSLLKDEEIEREKGVIIEEINLYEDTPARKIGDLIENLLYGDHPLGWDIAGAAPNIRKIKRQDFVNYMDAYYRPNNCVAAVAGGITKTNGFSESAMHEFTEKALGNWKKSPIKQSLDATDNQDGPKLLVRFKDTNQAHLALAVRSYPVGHPKRYALSLLSVILGGGMSSRLFIEIRERRGLAYYVRSGAEAYRDVGHFTTVAGVDMARIDDAIKVILEEYGKMKSQSSPITDEEFSKSKEYIKGRLTLELEDSQAVAGLYAGQEIIEDKMRTPEEIMRRIDSVTKEEIYAVAEDIFKQGKLNLAVIGPYKDEGRFEKLLNL